MTTAVAPSRESAQQFILNGVSWESYEKWLKELGDWVAKHMLPRR